MAEKKKRPSDRKKDEAKKKKKAVRSKPEKAATSRLNIGTVIYGMIAVYLLISVFLYLTAHHITSYQVKSGPLSQNEIYTALVLREEEVINSSGSGYISYFTGDSSKVSRGGAICSVSDNREMFTSATTEGQNVSSNYNLISKFAKAYNSDDFGTAYNLKYSLRQSTLYSDQGNLMMPGMQLASRDGVVAYTSDGYEYLSSENLSANDFKPKSYSRQNLQTDDKITAGTPLYRLITNDEWAIYIPVSEKQSARLEEYVGKYLKVRFLKDGQTEKGKFSLEENGGQKFARLDFYSGMIRYCNDRYLEVELITNIETGLKIPVSSIVEKECYVLPKDYRFRGGENNRLGFLVSRKDKNGTATELFLTPSCYDIRKMPEDSENEFCFVDKELLQEGDVLIKPESVELCTVGSTEILQGVYTINKGYTVFCKVDIIDQNEEYAIVRYDNLFGIELYDFIVRDAETVGEKDILFH